MAYSKTVWNNNTPPDISAENLNKMEQGIADAQFPDGGSTGQILSKTNDGTGWVDAPTSAEWGNIEGQISEQTDLYSELESKITMPSGGTTGQVLTKTASGQAWQDASGGGNVDTVNGISPDAQKNVQVDVELTQAQYDALPATKLTNNVNYFIKDGAYRPQGSVIDSEGVMYDNTESGLTSDTVQGAIDENASAIEELNNGLAQRKWVTITFDAISAYGLDTKTVDVSSNPAKFRQIVGWQLSNTTFLVPIQLYFSDTNKITCRVTNFTNNAISAGAPLTVFYI